MTTTETLTEIEQLADAMCVDVEPTLEDLARIRTLARQLLATERDLVSKADRLHTAAHCEAGHTTGPWRQAFDKLHSEILAA